MNLLIVDDEKYIVNYLFSLVESNFEDLNIQKATSAFDALSILSTSRIDLILLDINMPGCTGLELAEKVSKSWPRCHIIFLTAYDNFEYIYQANHFEHASYLLKTESDETILKEIQKNLDALKAESQTEMLLDDAQNKKHLLTHLLHQNILREIVSGHDIGQLQKELNIAGSDFRLDLSKPVYLGYMVAHLRSIDEYLANISKLTLEYLNPAERLLKGTFTYAMLNLNHGSMLWFFQPTEKFSQAIQSGLVFLKGFSEELMNYSMTALHRNMNILLYPDAIGWNNVSKIYYRLMQQLEVQSSQIAWPTSSVSIFENKVTKTPLLNTVSNEQGNIERKLQALSFYLYQNSASEYDKILYELQQECLALKSVHSLEAIQIYMGISSMLISYINLRQLQEKLASKIAIYPLYHLTDFNDWNEAFDYLKRFSSYLFELLSLSTTDKSEAVVQKIKSYIQEHISEPISLSTLSLLVNYNETYISRLFRQSTGTKLSEYIYQERISKARFLLSTTGEPIANIAAATGFDSQQYFSLVFKKSVGISPSEYQRAHYYNKG